MEANTKEIGVKESTVAKEFTPLLQVQSMMVIGLVENITDQEFFIGLTEVYTEVNGKIAEKMEKVYLKE